MSNNIIFKELNNHFGGQNIFGIASVIISIITIPPLIVYNYFSNQIQFDPSDFINTWIKTGISGVLLVFILQISIILRDRYYQRQYIISFIETMFTYRLNVIIKKLELLKSIIDSQDYNLIDDFWENFFFDWGIFKGNYKFLLNSELKEIDLLIKMQEIYYKYEIEIMHSDLISIHSNTTFTQNENIQEQIGHLSNILLKLYTEISNLKESK